MSKYTINDIVMLMYFIRDNEELTDKTILFYQKQMNNVHSLDSLDMKIKDISSCLQYQIDNKLVNFKIKYKKYNTHIGKYKEYNRGKMKKSLDLFIKLNNKDFKSVEPDILYNFFKNCVMNKNSKEYIENKNFQCNFIDNKINKTKKFIEDNFIDIYIAENNIDKIYHSINPWLRNIIVEFFNYKKEDKICKICSNDNIQRSHEVNRKNILNNVIVKYNLYNTSINLGKLLKLFILEHKEEPLWLLCSFCHKYFDKDYKNDSCNK